MTVALIAAGCMVLQDIISVILVQAEAANRGWLAGICDMFGWYLAIATTSISVTSLQGHSLSQKIWVLALVGAANIVGTKSGQVLGKRLLKQMNARDRVLLRAPRR